MRFSILTPLAFLLLLTVPYVLWVARRSFADLTRRRAKVLSLVRTAVAVLVAVALVRIILTSEKTDLPVSSVFCLDVSDSISEATRASAETFIAEALKTKQAEDRAGIVTFAATSRLAAPLSTEAKPVRTDERSDGSETDLASAIRLALAALPRDTEKRIVLLTDGHETHGEARRVAAEAARLGVRIDTLGLSSGAGPDVAVEAVNLPAFVRQSQPFEVDVALVSSARTRTTVKLYVDDLSTPAQEKELPVTDGSATVTFPVEIDREGPHLIRVTAETAGDALARNDSASALVKVGPRPTVLVVAANADDARYLARALESQQFQLRITTPEGVPKYAPDAPRPEIAAAMRQLLRFDVIILANVPAERLTREQMLLVNSYVYDFGGGLVMVGGRDSFASGGWYKTPVEAALPVYTDPMKEAPVFAVVLIMDKSWSMGDPQKGDVAKIDMIKESAIAAVERLTRKDHFALISFDTEVHTIFPMQRAEDIPAKVKTISTLASFGLTNFYPALVDAQRILKETAADYKHAILLSDGRPSGPGKDYEGRLEKMQKDHIVVSTVAVGVDADKKLMNNIAAWGKGQYYHTEDVKAVPDILLKETGRLKELLLVEGEFKARPGPRPHSPILKGIDIDVMPVVLGFNRSRAKETAQVEIVVSAKDEPLLASWRYGAGAAVAFTSDAKNIWCPAWIADWETGFARFWRQLVLGSLQLRRGDADYRMTLERDVDRTRLVLDVADRLGRFLPGQELSARLSSTSADVASVAEGFTTVALKPVAPGRYTAEAPVDRDRPLLVEVSDAAGVEVLTAGAPAVAPAEYRTVGTNNELLSTLRKLTGGKVARTAEVFERSGARTLRLLPFDYVLLALATLLFAADIFVRRMPALVQLFRARSHAA